ncbi:glycosyltransferase [Allopusillimonas soli]|uniref:Glycosyltransferase n=2 Tax=Allopusillimonas soli TaxID=659016 RepID=A0A853FCE2_9BURK|nr:glycosyltransferase [Allopusillimonas soli]NYT35726.1 glycosyltransferase [Allopusillimonas soli]TEA76115.1 glycosyltransferase [Allopusillimonas soli]
MNGERRPLRIAHIISGLDQGGAETVLYRLISAPGQTDTHCVISMSDEGVFGPRLREAGVAVHALHMRGPGGVARGLVRLYRLLRALGPDIVQTWMYHADLVGGLVARLAGIKAVAWGIRNSGLDLEKASRSARICQAASAPLSRFVPGVIIACAQQARTLHRQAGYSDDRMLVIPNGYDLSRWHPDAQVREAVRVQWGVGASTPVLGSVARFNPLKDHANLIEALSLCARAVPDVRCVLIGEGMDGANLPLMQMLDTHGVRDRVILLGRSDEVPALMNGLDVHVLSSRAEGFPNVVAEAMATGVLCAVTDVGDAAAMVGDAGWVAAPRNAQALAGAMEAAIRALGTPQQTERQARGRARVEDMYSLQAMVDAYHMVWARLARDYPARTRPEAQAHALWSVGNMAAFGADEAKAMPDADGLQGTERGMPGPLQTGDSAARRLLMVVNNPAFFLSHRLPIALGAKAAGYEVHIATMDGPSVPQIVRHGLTHHAIPMSRSGKNPAQELATIHALWRLCRTVRPGVVHAVTIKPVLYGGIAARLAGVPAYVAAISGLGFIFTRKKKGLDILRLAATGLYRLALGHPNSRVIFQNANDRDVLMRAGVVKAGQAVMIRGSGVDLDRYRFLPEPPGPPVAVMAARLLFDKGVREFVDAARAAAGHGTGLRWVLAGSPDPGNPASVTEAQLDGWRKEGVIEYLGECADVAALYARSHIVVLPSYREGLPKSLVEAAACGRAVVTTDVPGCRDAIEPGVTGLLVPAQDARALSEAVLELAEDGAKRSAMGKAGRALAERAFDIEAIAQAHLGIYDTLLRSRS